MEGIKTAAEPNLISQIEPKLTEKISQLSVYYKSTDTSPQVQDAGLKLCHEILSRVTLEFAKNKDANIELNDEEVCAVLYLRYKYSFNDLKRMVPLPPRYIKGVIKLAAMQSVGDVGRAKTYFSEYFVGNPPKDADQPKAQFRDPNAPVEKKVKKKDQGTKYSKETRLEMKRERQDKREKSKLAKLAKDHTLTPEQITKQIQKLNGQDQRISVDLTEASIRAIAVEVAKLLQQK